MNISKIIFDLPGMELHYELTENGMPVEYKAKRSEKLHKDLLDDISELKMQFLFLAGYYEYSEYQSLLPELKLEVQEKSQRVCIDKITKKDSKYKIEGYFRGVEIKINEVIVEKDTRLERILNNIWIESEAYVGGKNGEETLFPESVITRFKNEVAEEDLL